MIRNFIARIHPVKRFYWLGMIGMLLLYAVAALVMTVFFPFPETGPGAIDQPAIIDFDNPPRPGLKAPREFAANNCIEGFFSRVIFIDEGTGHPMYAVYCGTVFGTGSYLFTADTGAQIFDGSEFRRLGMWRYYGLVKSPMDWGIGAASLLAIFLLGYAELRQRAINLAVFQPAIGIWPVVAVVAFVLFSIVLPCLTVPIGVLIGGRYRARAFTVVRIWLWVVVLLVMIVAFGYSDPWGLWAVLFLLAALVITGLWLVLSPDRLMEAFPPRLTFAPAGAGVPSPAAGFAPLPPAAPAARASPAPEPEFPLILPDKLPSFKDVGGMEVLKKEIRESIGLMLAFADEAETYKISWNGFLLHGPPGTGKSYIARAIAGEYGLNFIPVSPSELTSSYLGESARLVKQVFEFAHDHAPCLLFFDEFDSLAAERDRAVDPERRLIVNQLLRSLEETRDQRELIVAAATNDLGHLDPAAIRPGRFDYHLHIGYPDAAAREAILAAQVAGIPAASDLDLKDIARRLDGFSAADIAGIVRKAALDVFRKDVGSGQPEAAKVTQQALLAAIESRVGRDRPAVGPAHWDEIILPAETKAELIELQHMIEDPELGRKLGVEPPAGVLLFGPPGTGKTTIARVLASESRTSFYPISAADILTMWYGESERNIRKLFERARGNRPAIIFIDELDALAQRRTGFSGVQDAVVNQLLSEMDGMKKQSGVFVLGATNRPDVLDPALLRGGRLSRQIEIPLPDAGGRAELLRLMTRRMPLARGADPLVYVEATEGFSGADIEAFCQQAAQEALSRIRTSGSTDSPLVEAADFANALADCQKQRADRKE